MEFNKGVTSDELIHRAIEPKVVALLLIKCSE
jgi:hypothetical protein